MLQYKMACAKWQKVQMYNNLERTWEGSSMLLNSEDLNIIPNLSLSPTLFMFKLWKYSFFLWELIFNQKLDYLFGFFKKMC